MAVKTIRFSDSIEKRISEIADELNISLNATMIVLLKLGLKLYDGNTVTYLKD